MQNTQVIQIGIESGCVSITSRRNVDFKRRNLMKLINIWNKLGKQSLHSLQHTDAIVFLGEDKYCITGIKYESGRPLGFEAIPINCSTCKNNVEDPPPHTCDICTSLDQEKEYEMWERK